MQKDNDRDRLWPYKHHNYRPISVYTPVNVNKPHKTQVFNFISAS